MDIGFLDRTTSFLSFPLLGRFLTSSLLRLRLRAVSCVLRLTMFTAIALAFLVFAASLATAKGREETDQVQQVNSVLQYFGANCTLNGEWSREATKSVNALLTTLQEMQADPACNGVTGTIAALNQANLALRYLNDVELGGEYDVRGFERTKSDLYFLLRTTTDPEEITLLKEQLRWTNLKLAEARGRREVEAEDQRTERRNQSLMAVVSASRTVLDRMARNEACWVKHAGVLTDVASFGTAVGQSVALGVVTGGISSIIGAGVNLIAGLIDWVAQRSSQKPVTSMLKTIKPTALTCALETMTNQYCSAQDAVEAINLVASAETSEMPYEKTWGGIRILNRDIPSLTQWLQKAQSGSEATSGTVGQERQSIHSKGALLDGALEYAIGRSQDLLRSVKGIPGDRSDDKTKRTIWDFQRQFILELCGMIHGGCSGQGYSPSSSSIPHPMAPLHNSEIAPYVLLGLKEFLPREDPKNPNSTLIPFSNFDPFTQWTGPAPFDPGIEGVVEEFKAWHRRAEDKFEIERLAVIYEDPPVIFTSAFVKILQRDYKAMSPFESITDILTYLKMAEPEYFPGVAFRALYADTVDRLTRVQRTMQKVIDNDGLDPMEGLKEINDAAHLKNGTDFFRNRLEFFVRVVIEQAVLKSDGLKDAVALQLLAATDIVKLLKDYANEPELQRLRTDAWNSQEILLGAIPSFLDTFQDPIASSLKNLDKKIEMTKEGSTGGPVTNSKAVMCMALMASPEWDSSLGMDRCLGTKVESVYKLGPKPLVFTKAIFGKPIGTRICNFRTFMRRNKVYQDLAEAGRKIPFKQHLNRRFASETVEDKPSSVPSKSKKGKPKLNSDHNYLIFTTFPNLAPSVRTEFPSER